MIHIDAPNNDSGVVCADVANVLFSGRNEKLKVSSYKISFTIDSPFHLNVNSVPQTHLTVSPAMTISYVGNKRKCIRRQPERRGFLISRVACNMSLTATLLHLQLGFILARY